MSAPINFEVIRGYGLRQEEIFKPLFCWMLTRIQSEFNLSMLESVVDDEIRRSLIYQQFIHSIIVGKHKELDVPEALKVELEYNIKNEKKMLRKIAALKMMYDDKLTQQILRNELPKFEDIMPSSLENRDLKNILDPIISSYFYLTSSQSYSKVDFIHSSFKEYLTAEYYIESLLLNKPYRLNVGLPSSETIMFLDGLLKLLFNDNTRQTSVEIRERDRLLKSFMSSANDQGIRIAKLRSGLINSAISTFTNPQIVFDTKSKAKRQEKEIWDTVELSSFRYPELWIHRWLCLTILCKLAYDFSKDIDKKELADFIVKTSHSVPMQLKQLNGLNLSGEDLTYAYLSKAYLSNADLSHTILFRTDFSDANLSAANLSEASLIESDLGDARLYGANLYKAVLNDARLNDVNFSNANLTDCELFRVKMFDATLLGTNMTNADLRNADLSNCDMTDAILVNANLTDANLSNAKLTRADFSNANLTDANLTGADVTDANFSGAKMP
jgi:uncharacterized protein YjbI with pentapeptide repeats